MTLVLRKGQEIIYDSSEEDEIVYLDRQLFKNILVNLISNAIKYSEDGRKIFIKLQKEQEMFEIEIKDQGMGIPKADQAHLFERFFRAHNVTHIQGTGLGLNLVKKYIDLMNGKISYQSEEGKGSTFVVKLPYKMN
jgi:signal transduction histidine kinase